MDALHIAWERLNSLPKLAEKVGELVTRISKLEAAVYVSVIADAPTLLPLRH